MDYCSRCSDPVPAPSNLTEPRSSLTKQYEKLFEMDGVKLIFTPESLDAVASLALERHTGARGLRSILERAMTDIMYEIPSRDDVLSVEITPDELQALLEEMQANGEPMSLTKEAFKEKYFAFYDDVKDKSLKKQDW